MRYKNIKSLSSQEFKRLSGVRWETFTEMVKAVKSAVAQQKKTGRPSKLSIEDQVLITLEYLREYRTYFHIGQEWGLNESNVYRTIRKVENILIQAKGFKLPDKKKLIDLSENIEVAVVDVTEHSIERPKKTENILQWQEKTAYFKISNSDKSS